MAGVFISYRRADTGDVAGRLADRLRALPQVDSVFLDVETIPVGSNFADKINHAINRTEHCLVLIGKNWRDEKPDGTARILNDDDIVRMEVASALACKAEVIPVLVNDAPMPATAELPPELQSLSTLSGFDLRSDLFARDAEALFDTMFGAHREKPDKAPARTLLSWLLYGGSGALLSCVLITVVAIVHQQATGKALNALVGYNRGIMTLFLLGIVLAGAGLGIWRPWKR